MTAGKALVADTVFVGHSPFYGSLCCVGAGNARNDRLSARIGGLKQKRFWPVSGGIVAMIGAAGAGRGERVASWVAQIVVAAILLQTLFFKFTAAPESVFIFSTLGLEPWGRLASGVAELIAAVLLLVPATAALGALVALGVIAGALGAHLTRLGIEVQGDGGLLFGLALVVAAGSLLVLWLRRRELPVLGARFAERG